MSTHVRLFILLITACSLPWVAGCKKSKAEIRRTARDPKTMAEWTQFLQGMHRGDVVILLDLPSSIEDKGARYIYPNMVKVPNQQTLDTLSVSFGEEKNNKTENVTKVSSMPAGTVIEGK